MQLECIEGGGLLNAFPASSFLWDPLWALPVFPAQPRPPPGKRVEQEGPDSQAVPLPKESYLSAAHSALNASSSWGAGPGWWGGRRGGGGEGGGGGGGGGGMVDSRCIFQPPSHSSYFPG